MNVHVSCAGQQLELVEAFKFALGPSGRVSVSDSDPLCVGAVAADDFILSPAFNSDGYLEWVRSLCVTRGIGLLLSLHEEDTAVLEGARSELAKDGCVLVGAPAGMIDRVVDKVELASVADAAGLIYPRTWSLATISEDSCASEGPFVLKARMGRGSRGQKVGLTLGEVFRWQSHFSEPERWIVQEQVPGTEFGIDVINDLSRAYRATFQRRKHQMRDGQTAVATSVKLASLDAAGESLSKVLGHQGCADVDLMVNGSEVALLDVNVRFGGGYMFSHAAGADLPAALIAWARGGEPPPESLVPVPGLTFARTSRIHAFGGSG